ncbi:hypothetical protein PHYSODRAFT_323105 [Phytophthora sojae]|uniref:CCHC-type domain-containing protein n=1 Tax=Phytophthora sojae (strain P6497) TaxID=1094619 RepID=G4YE19_PHYSP|nr:hypothetical protein PHYSODRAFT_323105 [Phytophthora sojae]EGZ29600.1 hypothetical protein PHYSODRAFT_323105 [Phytophthora sojae]|eukprot:XP_009516875.1 hypothetical protein PHYSODRAFT_323105 [Phytophthora sojae]
MSGVGEGEGSAEQRIVQEEVARLEAERLRKAGETGGTASTPAPPGDGSGTSTMAKVTSAAGRKSLRQEMMGDLWADEEEDEFKDADEECEEDGAHAELGPEEKRALSGPGEQRDGDSEDSRSLLSRPVLYYSSGFGYDDPVPIETAHSRPFYRSYVKEEPEEVPSRSPSGFIAPGAYGGWGTVVKTEPKVKQLVKAESSKTVTLAKTPTPGAAPAAKKHSTPVNLGGPNRASTMWSPARSAYDMSSKVSNVMKVLPVFYSDTATMEKARDFWELFEAHTAHLPDQSRLLVFRQKLKGRPAERWWNNSTIKTFATLKVRFHNQFLSRTADELCERLQTTKRERGESVEEWGDRVSDLCDSMDYPNPQMRYQLFRRWLRNKHMLATLDSGPARDIPEACEWLLAKEMSRPIEEVDGFLEDKKVAGSASSLATATVAASETLTKLDKLAETMTTFMTQQQQWQQQMVRNQWQPPRSPRNRVPNVSATTSSPGSGGNAPPGNGRPRGILMICNLCGELGHITVECEDGPSRGRTSGQAPVARNGGRGPVKCGFCKEDGHSFAGCPEVAALRGLAGEDRDRDEVEETVSKVDVCMSVLAEPNGTVPALDEVSYGENKDKNEKKKGEFIVVSTDDEGEDLAVKVGDSEYGTIYEDLAILAAAADTTVAVGELVALAADLKTGGVEEAEPTEVKAEPTEENAPELPSEKKDPDELPKVASLMDPEDVSAEEVPTPFADAPPPYALDDEGYDLSDCLFSAWTE